MTETNLWEETINVLNKHGLSFDDILYIQGQDFRIQKENFEAVAKWTNYNAGFGSQKVATDLVVVGEDWWLDRKEYDGSEWWEFNKKPERLEQLVEIDILSGGMWDTLKELKEKAEDD